MNETAPAPAPEIVGLLADRASFEACVSDLMAAGFDRADLSVLVSHESLEAAEPPERTWRDVLAGLTGEIRFEVPLVAAGAILYAGGPLTALIAAGIGGAVGGLALKDALEMVVSRPHAGQFAEALKRGELLLWVRADDPEREAEATAILNRHHARGVHRTAPEA